MPANWMSGTLPHTTGGCSQVFDSRDPAAMVATFLEDAELTLIAKDEATSEYKPQVSRGRDAIKAVMAGAHAVQMVSALLARGPAYLGDVREEMAHWLEQHEYDSLRQLQGSMSLLRCDNPGA